MIAASTFVTDTLMTVDRVIGHFVQTAFSNFIQAHDVWITSLFAGYISFLGYRMLTRTLQSDVAVMVRHLVILLCVYGLITEWSLYNLLVYNIFTNEPGNIAQVLVSSTGQMNARESVAQALNGVFGSVVNSAKGFFAQGGVTSSSGLLFMVYGGLIYAVGTTFCVVALVLFIYAKMAMAIGLALGPIFILFILWESTRELFSSWLRQLMTCALIPIITSAILALMLSVINVTLPSIAQPPEQAGFAGIAPFLGLTAATGLLLMQVYSMSSALGGGIHLMGILRAIDTLKSLKNLLPLGKKMPSHQPTSRASHAALRSPSSRESPRPQQGSKKSSEAAMSRKSYAAKAAKNRIRKDPSLGKQ